MSQSLNVWAKLLIKNGFLLQKVQTPSQNWAKATFFFLNAGPKIPQESSCGPGQAFCNGPAQRRKTSEPWRHQVEQKATKIKFFFVWGWEQKAGCVQKSLKSARYVHKYIKTPQLDVKSTTDRLVVINDPFHGPVQTRATHPSLRSDCKWSALTERSHLGINTSKCFLWLLYL